MTYTVNARPLRARLLAGVCMISSLLGAPALAQSTEATDASVLEEVVVTATRQSEVLSRVPVSVAAYTQQSMDQQGVRRVDDLARLTPGVNFTRGVFGLTTNISIRGISSTAGSATTGIYIDDTPIQVRAIGNSAGNAYPAVFDLQRVEILRGPQGTLFGAGSEGGTVRFITPEPNLSRYEGYARAELAFTKGGAPSYEFGAAVGGPIVEDKIGFRASAFYRRDGGFVDRVAFPTAFNAEENANYGDTKVLRAALTFAPAETLKITPSIYYQDLYSNDSNAYWLTVAGRRLSDPENGDYVSGARQPGTNKDQFVLPALKVRWDLGPVLVSSDTSYFFRTEDGTYDYTAFISNTFGGLRDPIAWLGVPGYFDAGWLNNKQNSWTQEFRVQSTDPEARFSWVAGLFWTDSLQVSSQVLQDPFQYLVLGIPSEVFYRGSGAPLPGGIVYVDGFRTHDRQTALFGEANFRVTDKLKITGGLRYAKTDLEFYTYRDAPAQGGPGSDRGTQKEEPLTPKLTISYQADEDNLFYATAAKGFRVGGVNRAIPTNTAVCIAGLQSLGYQQAPKTYESDSVWSYEVGAKNRLADGRVRVAASAYQIEWKNIIRPVAVPGCGFSFFSNLGSATSKGFDLQVDVAPVEGLQLGLMVGYNNVEFDASIRAAGATSNIVTKGHTLGGNPWTVTVNGQYDFVGPMGLDSYVRADYTYRGKNDGLTPASDPTNANYDALVPLDPSTHQLRLRAGVKVKDADLSVFVNNATNDLPKLGIGHGTRTGQIFTGAAVRPITAGVTVGYRF